MGVPYHSITNTKQILAIQHATLSVTHPTLGYTENISSREPHLASRKTHRLIALLTDHVWEMSPEPEPQAIQTRAEPPTPNQANSINSLGQHSLQRPYSTTTPSPYHTVRSIVHYCRSSSVAEPLRQPAIHHTHLPDCLAAGCGRT